MNWLNLALILFRVTNGIVTLMRERNLLNAGEDRAIAKAAVNILRLTDAGKKMTERIDAMAEPEFDDLLADLGKPDKGG